MIRAGRNRPLVFARQIVVLGIPGKAAMRLQHERSRVEQLFRIQSSHRAASDVAQRVTASGARGKAGPLERGEGFLHRLQPDAVNLQVLARCDFDLIVPMTDRQFADGAELRGLQDAVGNLDAHHETAGLGFVVVETVPLEEEDVLFSHGDRRGAGEPREFPGQRSGRLAVLNALDGIAAQDFLGR